jgi:hypothetical protein
MKDRQWSRAAAVLVFGAGMGFCLWQTPSNSSYWFGVVVFGLLTHEAW